MPSTYIEDSVADTPSGATFRRTLVLRSDDTEGTRDVPGGRVVFLGHQPAGVHGVPWKAGEAVPVDGVLDNQVYDVIRDETHFAPEAKRALFLALFPALAFCGAYVISVPLGGVSDPAFAALAGALARGTLTYSRAGIIHGQSDRSYAENMVGGVTFRRNEVTVTKFAGEGEALNVVRAVPRTEFPGKWREVVREESYLRGQPHVFDNPAWLRPRLENEIRRPQQRAPAGFVGELANVTVVGDGAIHDRQSLILADSLQNISAQRVIPHFYRLSESTYASLGWVDEETTLDLPNLVMLKQPYDGNYGHWVMETLPRMGMVARCVDPAACHVMVMGWYQPMLPVFRDSLRWCGVAEDRIIVSGNGPIRAEKLIFPTPIAQAPWIFSPFAHRFLEELAGRIQQAHPAEAGRAGTRIYLSRNQFGRRRIENEDEIAAFLAARGYAVLYPETMTFTEQVLALSRASHVVANMGAALTNAVFAPRGVRVLALATENMPDDFFWDITAQKGGTYFSLHGPATEPEKGMQSDFRIAIARLREVFAEFDPG